MPTFAVGPALLNLTAEFRRKDTTPQPDVPWCWESWQTIVRTTKAPWELHPEGSTHIFSWNASQIACAKAYVDHFCSLPTLTERLEFAQAKNDNENEGRTLVQGTLARYWLKEWRVGDIIWESMRVVGKDRDSIVAAHGEMKVSLLGASISATAN